VTTAAICITALVAAARPTRAVFGIQPQTALAQFVYGLDDRHEDDGKVDTYAVR
jgi:hypothetical protein